VYKLKKYNKEVEIEFVSLDYNRAETIANALSNVDKLFLLVNPASHLSVLSI
jgi:hypothetical protein